MEDNPYSSPSTSSDDDRVINPTIEYRVFAAKSFTFKLNTDKLFDEVRQQAQAAIEHDIGAENVVSITENGGSLDRFCVVVWYRSRKT